MSKRLVFPWVACFLLAPITGFAAQKRPPAAPANLTATSVEPASIRLDWADRSANETGFRIERSRDGVAFTQIATVGANVVTFINSGLRASILFHYRVRARNKAGSSAYTAIASAVSPAAPPAPTPVPTPLPTASPTQEPVASSCNLAAISPGPGADLGGARLFPDDNPWNQDVSAAPVDPSSATLLANCGARTTLHPDFGTEWDGAPNGIPYVVVSGAQGPVDVSFTDYGDESDPGPYPVPPDAPIEGGPNGEGDRHVIVVDKDNCRLYEMFYSFPLMGGAWNASCGATWDTKSNDLRPAGWTSADAAGLPIFPGLVRYDEAVIRGVISHALRFTCDTTRRGYVPPARHFASANTDPAFPPMGMRVRLKAGFDISSYTPEVRAILVALKKYGMILADNGGTFFISGAPDPRWNDDNLWRINQIPRSALEVIELGPVTTTW